MIHCEHRLFEFHIAASKSTHEDSATLPGLLRGDSLRATQITIANCRCKCCPSERRRPREADHARSNHAWPHAGMRFPLTLATARQSQCRCLPISARTSTTTPRHTHGPRAYFNSQPLQAPSHAKRQLETQRVHRFSRRQGALVGGPGPVRPAGIGPAGIVWLQHHIALAAHTATAGFAAGDSAGAVAESPRRADHEPPSSRSSGGGPDCVCEF
jgi:hypothetical protein